LFVVIALTMDNTLVSVLAALGGSIVGASTPVLSNFVLQRSLTQRELTNREIAQSLEKMDDIVAMYALVNRIRLFASESVLEAAEAFVRQLIARYGEHNMSIEELKTVALEQHADPLNDFALKCRMELRQVYERAAWGKP
jgi:hypothetical protein